MKNTITEEILKCIVVYDVNCQYYKNFLKRVDASPYLEVHPGLVIIPGIGLFHVHGHQLICLARFSPTFIQGAGQSDGEILETMWLTLNHVGRISQTMTLAHRTEVLDSHMGDNNWKKLVNMGEFEIYISLVLLMEFSIILVPEMEEDSIQTHRCGSRVRKAFRHC